MKILIFNWRDISHPWAGGAERHLHELAKGWLKHGNSIDFLAGRYSGAREKEIIDGIRIFRIGNMYTNYLLAPIYYLKNLKKNNYDVIIETSHGIPNFARLFTRKKIILVVHHNHKKLWKSEFGHILAEIGIFLENKVVPFLYKNQKIIVLSDTSKNELNEIGFKDVIAIPPGINTKFFVPAEKKFKHPTILYLGRLRRYKRVELLLTAYTDLSIKIPDLQVIIAGDGQDMNRLHHLARERGIEDKIIFKGYVSEDEKLELLQKAWVLAFPSVMEGWGLVSTEAGACGTPTVGFNVPGVKDAVLHGKSGYLASNTGEFISYIKTILTDELLRKRLNKGAIKWSKNFTWEKSSDIFLHNITDFEINEDKIIYDKKYFSSFLRGGYKRRFKPVYNFRLNYIKNRMKPLMVLDVGCGTGFFVKELNALGIPTKGVDISSQLVTNLPLGLKEYVSIGNLKKLNFKDDSFDTVICIDVLEHIKLDDIPQALKECARVASKQILFDITVLEDFLFIHSDRTHVSKYFSFQWKRKMEEVLGKEWEVKRAYTLPFIHNGAFILIKK